MKIDIAFFDKKRFIPFLVVYFAILILVGILLCIYPKGELHIMLNAYHTPLLDTFFWYYTKLAEWPFYVIAVIPLFFAKYRWCSFFYIACEVSNSIISTIVKYWMKMDRPAAFFGQTIGEQVNLVDGIHLHFWHSFPSGHACTFFTFFTIVTLLRIYYRPQSSNASTFRTVVFDFVSIILVLLAVLGAYSRIYLSQHFLLDCFAGSLLGVALPSAILILFLQKGWDKPYYFRTSSSSRCK